MVLAPRGEHRPIRTLVADVKPARFIERFLLLLVQVSHVIAPQA
jgi:hypothetical protein